MPCFNAAGTIDEAIASLLPQTLADFELIAADDGSADSTLERIRSWAGRDVRIRLLSLPHAGIVQALNAGLAACRAPLIARMDADDLAHPERLEAQARFLREHPEIAAAGCLVEGFPEAAMRQGSRLYLDWLNGLLSPEAIAREIFIESPLAHPSALIRREWLERLGGYQDLGWPEDYDLWLRLHLQGARFAKVPQVLLRWREHPDRLTKTDSRYSVENFLRAKAHYLQRGPLHQRDGVILWGAGQIGRRISKHLLREGATLAAFVDIDPRKIGRTVRERPVIPPEDLPSTWKRFQRPALLAAVATRGARGLIRERLGQLGMLEGEDWWAVA